MRPSHAKAQVVVKQPITRATCNLQKRFAPQCAIETLFFKNEMIVALFVTALEF